MSTVLNSKISAVRDALGELEAGKFDLVHAKFVLQESRSEMMNEYCNLVDSLFRLRVKYESMIGSFKTLKNDSQEFISEIQTIFFDLHGKIEEVENAIGDIIYADPTGNLCGFLKDELDSMSKLCDSINTSYNVIEKMNASN